MIDGKNTAADAVLNGELAEYHELLRLESLLDPTLVTWQEQRQRIDRLTELHRQLFGDDFDLSRLSYV